VDATPPATLKYARDSRPVDVTLETQRLNSTPTYSRGFYLWI